jgi:hypothetical protein
METIGKKIRGLIREKGYRTIQAFYQDLSKTFEKTAINRSTLTRILKDQVVVRERTLNQLALILGVKTSSLREGTNAQVDAAVQSERVFTYNEAAALKVLDNDLPFVAGQLTLKKNGRTTEEQDSAEETESLKWVFVLVGTIRVVVEEPGGSKTITLHKSRKFSFDARQRHHFENASANTSLCLVLHYPARNNRILSGAE